MVGNQGVPIVYQTAASKISVCDYSDTLAEVAALGGCELVITSPPYDDARTYDNDVSWKFEDYKRLGDKIFAALKPGGNCLMVLDGPVKDWRKGMGKERSFTPWRVLLDWADRVGFRVPDHLAYVRRGVPGKFVRRFRNDWEPLLWFQRPGAHGYFDSDALMEPASPKSINASPTKIATHVRTRVRAKIRKSQTAPGGMKNRGTLWTYGSTDNGRDRPNVGNHPARFATKFAEDGIRCFCPPDGLVCDPFVGSGTSAVAAIRHGRRFIGGDLFGDKAGKPWALYAHERVQAEFLYLGKAPTIPIISSEVKLLG